MKRICLIVSSLLLMFACEEKGKKFNVVSSYKQNVYSGATITFNIESKKNYVPDSVLILVDGNTQTFFKTKACPLSTEGFPMGEKTVTIQTYYDGKKEVHLRSIRILSDIVPAKLKYEIVASYNHDNQSYTQGLQFENGTFYESAGLYDESSLRYVDVKTGKVLRKKAVDSAYFAEGLTIVGDSLYQLTWREQTGFIYNKHTFEQIGAFTYPTEGWGLCYNGTYLIVSDGTEYLYFYEPKSMSLHHKIAVYDNLGAVSSLNELEFVQGFVYANIYTTDKIVKINPNNGKVAAEIDFTDLLPEQFRNDVDVLNGIAWNPQTDHFYITGKLWPRLFEVRLYFQE